MLDKEKVGRAILEQRKIKRMTQKQLADFLHVSYQAVSRWEQGISLPSVDMIYDIAQTLETSVDFLLKGLAEERKTISYMDSGLDARRMHMIKERLNRLVTESGRLFQNRAADPVFFKPDIAGMEEMVCAFASHVPGSKERFAMENGYDREICMDLVANAANNLIRFGVKPAVLQAHIVCGNNDGGQLLIMGEAFKETCEKSGILFAGMEVAAQPVNYRAGEYKLGAVVVGFADKKKLITGEEIREGDVLIGLHTDGISSISYPFVKVMLDRKPEMAYAKIDSSTIFMDALMKPNLSFVNAIGRLQQENLIHGIFSFGKSLFNRCCYEKIPRGLGACIFASQIEVPALFRYMYGLGMMDRENFLENFSMGIGMMLAVPKAKCGRAMQIMKESHTVCRLGRIEKDDEHCGERVWMEGGFAW